jgi:hypothetical protein
LYFVPDPILHNGVCRTLRARHDVWLVDAEPADPTTVALLASIASMRR